MQILIDGDACPVTGIAVKVAGEFGIPAVLISDTNHSFHIPGVEWVPVDPGADSADLALANRCRAGDAVITQDYGVAALALGKRAYAIHPSGMIYTDGNIDTVLAERHTAQKLRRSGRAHLKGPSKRTADDDRAFETAFRQLIAEGRK